ncbi:5-dehydro-4-deoxyglucarate dehydratase [Salipaludibacillus neizhouensis]|uniref:Probable 5-dehydro-4-deoxyglucarate dehydratase n=1 Tax=Salipaludibacillus neizhouensis TaxID=885475 RepID=A0A3A9K5S7_9BACI|nr:5-dehydro-4-deoxyglucarate dehydratase [Salipaludibacillus neizhouensis]RKL65043.1 5-dehydro-4-deoxyglucarate dehydratase [Salipaludibacillus neizhouensis]
MNSQRKSPTGILGFPITPFDEHGRIDEQALSRNVEFLINNGLEAIFICAGSGEFQSLNRNEYELMVDIAVSTTKNKVPVYTSIGGNISTSIELAEISKDKGADGYLIFPPYLIDPEQEGLYNYYKTLIRSTDLNAIIYQRGKAVFTVDTIERLAEFPQFVGLKDGIGNMELNIELTQSLGGRLEWINGMPFGEITMPGYFGTGFHSYSSAIANYIPHIARTFFEALKRNDKELVDELYKNVLFPINNLRKQRKGYNVSLIKAGMEIIGLPIGSTVRPPLIPVEKEHFLQLETILKEALEKYPVHICK